MECDVAYCSIVTYLLMASQRREFCYTVDPRCATTSHKQPPTVSDQVYSLSKFNFPSQISVVGTSRKQPLKSLTFWAVTYGRFNCSYNQPGGGVKG